MREEKRIINESTGEIIRKSYTQFTEHLNDEGYQFPYHKKGARIFDEVKFPGEMTHAEIGRMTVLSKLMIGKTNMLGYRQGKNIYPYTAQEIGEMVGLSGARARGFVHKMSKYRVMQKVVTASGAQYYINPAYFMASGQRLSLDLFLLFREDLSEILPWWVKSEFLRQAKTKRITPGQAITAAEEILREKE